MPTSGGSECCFAHYVLKGYKLTSRVCVRVVEDTKVLMLQSSTNKRAVTHTHQIVVTMPSFVGKSFASPLLFHYSSLVLVVVSPLCLRGQDSSICHAVVRVRFHLQELVCCFEQTAIFGAAITNHDL